MDLCFKRAHHQNTKAWCSRDCGHIATGSRELPLGAPHDAALHMEKASSSRPQLRSRLQCMSTTTIQYCDSSQTLPSNISPPLTMPESTFPFFHLAAELRELIYLELLQTKTLILPNNLHLEAHNLPSMSLLLLNRQFHAEYSSLAFKNSYLVIKDSPRATKNPNSFQLTLPPQARRIGKVQFNLACTHFTKDAVAELDFHHTWTRQILAQLDYCASVCIDIHLAAGVKAKDYEAALNWSGYWCDLAGLKELRVWRVERGSTAWCVARIGLPLIEISRLISQLQVFQLHKQEAPPPMGPEISTFATDESRLGRRAGGTSSHSGECQDQACLCILQVFANVWLNTVQRRES